MAKKTKKIHHDHIAEGLRTLAVDITTLRQDPANARLHNDQNIEAIMSSLSKFGQRKPVVVNKRDGIVEAGNGTLQAAKSLGWSHVAAVFVDDDPATATGFAIADNRTAELATWDEETLGRLLESIGDEMPAIELGFSDEQLAEIMAPLNEDPIGEDVEPTEPPKEPVSQRGEVFELGPHRLMCGDSTSKEDVAALLCGEKPNLMVTDPPYGVEYDATWRGDAGHATLGKNRTGLVENDDRIDWFAAWSLFPGDVFYCWHAGVYAGEVQNSLQEAGFLIRSQIIWNKTVMVMGRGAYHWKHEPCWYSVRKNGTTGWIGGRDKTTIWDLASPLHIMSGSKEEKTPHPTQKPLECMERPIRNHEGDVYDPFLGSGTTLIAAARQGRKCYGMEISPAYCDVIRKRWTAYAKENGLEAGTGAL